MLLGPLCLTTHIAELAGVKKRDGDSGAAKWFRSSGYFAINSLSPAKFLGNNTRGWVALSKKYAIEVFGDPSVKPVVWHLQKFRQRALSWILG